MPLDNKNTKTAKAWTILYIATTIASTIESNKDAEIDKLTDQLIVTTMLELSKSVLKLNNGQWD